MSAVKKPRPEFDQIAEWLAAKYGGEVSELAPISGGFWSAAYTYRVGDEDLVLRFSDLAEGFVIDKAAMQFASAELPIPTVYEIGEALGHHYAISKRCFGRFVEEVSPDDADAVGGAMAKLLMALRTVPSKLDDAVIWDEPEAKADVTWHEWLRNGLRDRPGTLVSGWRETLAQHAEYDAIFSECERRIEALLPKCPERRDLVHGDLYHQNVLVNEDATQVTGIFSWKCSVRGDFLFDIALTTIWEPWQPGIAAANLWQRTLEAPDLSEADLVDAPLRHHCYELRIAAEHFGWNIWTKNDVELAKLVERTKFILERGPLPT